MTDLEQLRYPVGRFERPKAPLDGATRSGHIETIERTPSTFLSLVKGRTDAELDTPYRPGGWTVRQVVHHVPDSHMNAYIRMKFAVTEDAPAIKAYDEAKWAELPEAKSGPAEMSLALLEALHRRWVTFLRGTDRRRLRQGLRASRAWPRHARRSGRLICVALPSSRGAYKAGIRD